MLQIILAGCAVVTAIVLFIHVLASGDYKKHRLYVISMLGLLVTGPVGLGFRGAAPDVLPAGAFLGITLAQTVFVSMVLGTTTPSWRGVILDNLLRLSAAGTIIFLAADQWRPAHLGNSQQIMMVAGLCVIASGIFKLHMSKARADFAEAEARALQRFALFHMAVGALWILAELFPSRPITITMQIAICFTGVFSVQYLSRRTANKEFTPRRRPPKPRVAFDQYILTSAACLGTLMVAVFRHEAPVGLMSMAAVCVLALVLRQIITVLEYEDLNNYSEANERRFGLLVRSASDVISLGEPTTHILRYVSPAVTELLGQTPEDTIGEHASTILGINRAQIEDSLSNLTEDAPPLRLEGKIDDKAVESIVSRRGEHLVITTRDVTERQALKAQLRELAYNDPLTGLNNRRRFDELMREATAENPGANVLFYIDLNKFKAVNDDHGHEAGDQILETVAERLRKALPDDAILGRRGGDEFVAAVPRNTTLLPEESARRVLSEVRCPYVTDFGTFTLGCAIGIAYPEHGALPDDMMRNADHAMYAAKRGQNPIVVYTPVLDSVPGIGGPAQPVSEPPSALEPDSTADAIPLIPTQPHNGHTPGSAVLPAPADQHDNTLMPEEHPPGTNSGTASQPADDPGSFFTH